MRMILTAYVPQVDPAFLQLWVGLFDTENPPAQLGIRLDGVDTKYEEVAPLRPIRDSMTGPNGQPVNHRTVVRIPANRRGRSYRIEITADTESFELLTNTLPAAVPQALDGTFNVLLCSCYSQPDDAGGLLGKTVEQIKLRPQLTLMLGDQIYGDLPLFEDLPDDAAGVARKLGAKYRRNWALSQLGPAGLGPVLARAPVVCVADDHEFWNNYPFKQTQLPHTWTDGGRRQWGDVARALYDDYQMPGPHMGAQRIDIDPLKILVVDLRCDRDEVFDRLENEQPAVGAVTRWADDLIEAKNGNQPAIGVLCSGQALFVNAAEESKRVSVDAEMANYTEFAQRLMPEIEKLADRGITVIYITGDVHWGRVSQGLDVRSNRTLLYEVISSPARLITTPVLDSAKTKLNAIKGIFGKADPWPRHGNPDPVPDSIGTNGRFRLRCDLASGEGFAQRGDQVSVISFARAGGGVDFSVTYYAISEDKALAKSRSTQIYSIRP